MEFAYIAISISENILSFTPHHILSKLAFIFLKISESVLSQTFLDPKTKFSFIIIPTSKILLPQTMRQMILNPSNIFTPIFEYKLHYFYPLLHILQFLIVKRDILTIFLLFKQNPLMLLIRYPDVQGQIINTLNLALIAQFIQAETYFEKHRVDLLPFLNLAQLLDNVFSCTRTQPTSHPNYYYNLNNNPNQYIITIEIIYLPYRH